MNYLLIYPNGDIKQTNHITRRDTEDARIFGFNKAGFSEATEFSECFNDLGDNLHYVGVEWWKEPPWILRKDLEEKVSNMIGFKRQTPSVAISRSPTEVWLGKHNHLMELLRTFTSALAAMAGLLVLLKVFGWL